jgi:hypothetical protein
MGCLSLDRLYLNSGLARVGKVVSNVLNRPSDLLYKKLKRSELQSRVSDRLPEMDSVFFNEITDRPDLRCTMSPVSCFFFPVDHVCFFCYYGFCFSLN